MSEEQKTIIESPSYSRILVEAGPGTGKTEVVAKRIIWLLEKYHLSPSNILVLSFSRSAVKALTERIRAINLIDDYIVEDLRHLCVRTFDSWSYRRLRLSGYDSGGLLNNKYDENIQILISDWEKYDPNNIIDGILDELIINSPEIILEKLLSELIPYKYIESSDNDQLTDVREIKHIIVDELQDLTGVRAKLVFLLLSILVPQYVPKKFCNCGFTILGDQNQSIYEWTQKDDTKKIEYKTSTQLIEEINKEYKDLIKLKLNTNYRSANEISDILIKASNILNSENGANKKLLEINNLANNHSSLISLENIAKKIVSTDSTMKEAILCRENSQVLDVGFNLERILDSNNFGVFFLTNNLPPIIPSWFAWFFYKFKSVEITCSNFEKIYKKIQKNNTSKLPCNNSWELTWKLLLNFAKSSENDTAIKMDSLRDRIIWYDSLPDDEGEISPKFIITTIHKSKGLEYECVNILNNSNYNLTNINEYNEEARICYVAMSRAKKKLFQVNYVNNVFKKEQYDGGKRTRYHRWFRNGLQQLEIGLKCDIDENSFVSRYVFDNEDSILDIQRYLEQYENQLIGKELILEKTKLPNEENKYVYNIKLKDPFEGQQLLGRTSELLTLDLRKLKLWNQSLPKNIYHLKIRNITSIVGNKIDNSIPPPWSISKIWLGVNIYGLGQFKFFYYRN